MTKRQRLQTATLLALLAMMMTVNGALAHAAHDPSLAHQILDSAWIPALGTITLIAVSVSWWRARGTGQH